MHGSKIWYSILHRVFIDKQQYISKAEADLTSYKFQSLIKMSDTEKSSITTYILRNTNKH